MPLTKNQKTVATGQLKVLQKLNPYEFGVELWLMREGQPEQMELPEPRKILQDVRRETNLDRLRHGKNR